MPANRTIEKKTWQLKKPGNSAGLLCFQTLPDHAHRLPPMPSAAVNNEQVLGFSDTFFELRMFRSTPKQNLEAKQFLSYKSHGTVRTFFSSNYSNQINNK